MTKTNSGTDGNNYDISVTTEEIETGFTPGRIAANFWNTAECC
ncbi:MAG: hypothetical protein ACLU99_01765 [Alphaproteobacteria bacterium]